MVDTWTIEEAAAAIAEGADPTEYAAALRVKRAEGKGIAVYRNEDLGHPGLGHCIALTYGTPAAQFEPEQFPDGPPTQCPDGLLRDITGGINWRYRLAAIVPAGFPHVIREDFDPIVEQ